MKLTRLVKDNSGNSLHIHFTMSEFIAIVSMFETGVEDWKIGMAKEKGMNKSFNKMLHRVEEILKSGKSFDKDNNRTEQVYYESKKRKVEQIQGDVSNGNGNPL